VISLRIAGFTIFLIGLGMFKCLILLIMINFSVPASQLVRVAYADIVGSIGQPYIKEVEEIYKRIGVPSETIIVPSSRAVYYFETNRADALGLRVGSYEQLNPNALKVNVPIVENFNTRAWFLRSSHLNIKNKKKPSVIAIRGDIAPEIYSKKMKLKIDNYSLDLEMAVEMLRKKRVDVLIHPELGIKNTKYDKELIPYNNRVHQEKLFHFIQKSNSFLLKKLEAEFINSKNLGKFGPKSKASKKAK